MPLVGEGVRIKDDDAMVAVAIGDIEFIGAGIDPEIGGLAKLPRVLIALAWAGLAELFDELSIARELQQKTVVLVVAAEQHGVADDAYAMLLLWPFITRAFTAPGLNDIAFLIELDHGRRRDAARRLCRLLRCGGFEAGQAARPLDDPDMILLIDSNACDLSEGPVVGQGLWPIGVDFKLRRIGGGCKSGPEQQGECE